MIDENVSMNLLDMVLHSVASKGHRNYNDCLKGTCLQVEVGHTVVIFCEIWYSAVTVYNSIL